MTRTDSNSLTLRIIKLLGIAGIAVLAGRVSAPRSGSFYTISLREELNGRPVGWTILR